MIQRTLSKIENQPGKSRADSGDHDDDIFDRSASPVYHSQSTPSAAASHFNKVKSEINESKGSSPTCTQQVIDDEEFPFEDDDDFGISENVPQDSKTEPRPSDSFLNDSKVSKKKAL